MTGQSCAVCTRAAADHTCVDQHMQHVHAERAQPFASPLLLPVFTRPDLSCCSCCLISSPSALPPPPAPHQVVSSVASCQIHHPYITTATCYALLVCLPLPSSRRPHNLLPVHFIIMYIQSLGSLLLPLSQTHVWCTGAVCARCATHMLLYFTPLLEMCSRAHHNTKWHARHTRMHAFSRGSTPMRLQQSGKRPPSW